MLAVQLGTAMAFVSERELPEQLSACLLVSQLADVSERVKLELESVVQELLLGLQEPVSEVLSLARQGLKRWPDSRS